MHMSSKRLVLNGLFLPCSASWWNRSSRRNAKPAQVACKTTTARSTSTAGPPRPSPKTVTRRNHWWTWPRRPPPALSSPRCMVRTPKPQFLPYMNTHIAPIITNKKSFLRNSISYFFSPSLHHLRFFFHFLSFFFFFFIFFHFFFIFFF